MGDIPTLLHYPGTPKHRLIQQILTGPAFGVSTVHEENVTALREEYRKLKKKMSRTPLEETELLDLEKKLGEMQSSSDSPHKQQNLLKVFNEFNQALILSE